MLLITDVIQEILSLLLKESNIPNNDIIEIEIPKDEKHGDFSSPLPLKTAKLLKINPVALGENLVQSLIKKKYPFFEKIEFVKPGFINFFLSPQFLINALKDIFQLKANYGQKENKNPDNVIIEFVSANPTGPLNVVNARSACVGEVIADLLKWLGHKVIKEYYINDAGHQVELLAQSIDVRIQQYLKKEIELKEEHYQGEYIKDIAKEIVDTGLYDKMKNQNDYIHEIKEYALNKIIDTQKRTLKKYNVEFDHWFSEKELRKGNELENCLKLLKEKDLIFIQDNKTFFRSTTFGDEKDRVIIRDNGEPTYFFVDIAYHYNKIQRRFTKIIDLWGPDHDSHITRMKGAMQALGYNQFYIYIIQQVNLIEKSQKIKMSKRLGSFVLMDELINDIGVDAARFFFLHRSISSHLDFDMELAKKQTDENPVYYIQYAYARICNIFVQAKNKKIIFEGKQNFNQDTLTHEEIKLMKKLNQNPVIIKEAGEKIQPNLLTNYLLELAAIFHQFYTENRVISDDEELTQNRLYLVECTRIIIKNTLDIIGVSAPERM